MNSLKNKNRKYQPPEFVIKESLERIEQGRSAELMKTLEEWVLHKEVSYFIEVFLRLPPKNQLRIECLNGSALIGSEASAKFIFESLDLAVKHLDEEDREDVNLKIAASLGKSSTVNIFKQMIKLFGSNPQYINLFSLWAQESILRKKDSNNIAFFKEDSSPYPLINQLPFTLLEIEKGLQLPKTSLFCSSFQYMDIQRTKEVPMHPFHGKVEELKNSNLYRNIRGIVDDGEYVEAGVFNISKIKSVDEDVILRNIPLPCLQKANNYKSLEKGEIAIPCIKKEIITAKQAFKVIFDMSVMDNAYAITSAGKARGKAWMCLGGLLGFEVFDDFIKIQQKAYSCHWVYFQVEQERMSLHDIGLMCIQDNFQTASIVQHWYVD